MNQGSKPDPAAPQDKAPQGGQPNDPARKIVQGTIRADIDATTSADGTISAMPPPEKRLFMTTSITTPRSANGYCVGEQPIEGYTLAQFLGQGGFGEVWRAKGPGGIDVALKIISLSRREGAKEFKSLKLIKAIRHPNLVPIVAFWLKDGEGRTLREDENLAEISRNEPMPEKGASKIQTSPSGSQLIIAMGLGDMSVTDRLEQCRQQGDKGIPYDELLIFMQDAASGIDFLNHDQALPDGTTRAAIQHCDIKPQNMMIVSGRVQVCDFGLARAINRDMTMTSIGVSAAYGAPELLEGQPPSSSTDQYSLAISYVELRTDALPFSDLTFAGARVAHLSGKLNLAGLSPSEQKVIRRATARNPRDRYPTCGEMVRDLLVARNYPDSLSTRGRGGGALKVLAGVALLVAGIAALFLVPWEDVRTRVMGLMGSSSAGTGSEIRGLIDQRDYPSALEQLEAQSEKLAAKEARELRRAIHDGWLDGVDKAYRSAVETRKLPERRKKLREAETLAAGMLGGFRGDSAADDARRRIAAALAATANDNVYAVIVGVNQCPRFHGPDKLPSQPLAGAEHDADSLYAVLVDEFGLAEDHVRLLKGDQATHTAIRQAVADLGARSTNSDQFLFYFAGYGAQAIDSKASPEEDHYSEALCPFDATESGNQLIRDDELARWLTDVRAGKLTVVLDCSPGGPGLGNLVKKTDGSSDADAPAKTVPRFLVTSDVLRPAASDPNVLFTLRMPWEVRTTLDPEPWKDLKGASSSPGRQTGFFASAGNQAAYEQAASAGGKSERAGMFSQHLVEGLRGAADSNADEVISRQELADYVQRRVDATFNRNRPDSLDRQTPTLDTDNPSAPFIEKRPARKDAAESK